MQHYAAFHLGLHCLPKFRSGVVDITSSLSLKVIYLYGLFLFLCIIRPNVMDTQYKGLTNFLWLILGLFRSGGG